MRTPCMITHQVIYITPITHQLLLQAGLNTADEMMLVYFHYMLYQNGDENYNMDSLMQAGGLGLIEPTLRGAFEVHRII